MHPVIRVLSKWTMYEYQKLEIKTSAKKNGRSVRGYQPKLLIKIVKQSVLGFLYASVS